MRLLGGPYKALRGLTLNFDPLDSNATIFSHTCACVDACFAHMCVLAARNVHQSFTKSSYDKAFRMFFIERSIRKEVWEI